MGRIAEIISQVLSTIRASISTTVSAVRSVVVPVFRGGKWVYETVQETYTDYVRPAAQFTGRAAVAVARPTLAVAEGALAVTAAVCRPVVNGTAAIGRPILKSAAAVALLPATAVGAVLGAMGSHAAPVGKQAAAAAQQAQDQVQQQAQKADRDQQVISQARLWQRAAKWKAHGRDVTHYADVMQPGEIAYLKRLTVSECKTLADADVRVVADWLYGNRPAVPGVRSPSEIRTETVGRTAPEPTRTAEEEQVLNALQKRLLERGYSKRIDEAVAFKM